MRKVYLYISGTNKAAQRGRLQAEFPNGEEVNDLRPPEMLDKLIAEAGPGDIIAADNIAALPITVDTYRTVCSKGAELYFIQQPFLYSGIFSPYLTGDEQAAASAILNLQIEAVADQRTHQRQRERAGLESAAAAGRKGGRRAGEPQTSRKELYMKEAMKKLMAQGVTGQELMERLNDGAGELRISRNTFYKYRRELKAQEPQETLTGAQGNEGT